MAGDKLPLPLSHLLVCMTCGRVWAQRADQGHALASAAWITRGHVNPDGVPRLRASGDPFSPYKKSDCITCGAAAGLNEIDWIWGHVADVLADALQSLSQPHVHAYSARAYRAWATRRKREAARAALQAALLNNDDDLSVFTLDES